MRTCRSHSARDATKTITSHRSRTFGHFRRSGRIPPGSTTSNDRLSLVSCARDGDAGKEVANVRSRVACGVRSSKGPRKLRAARTQRRPPAPLYSVRGGRVSGAARALADLPVVDAARAHAQHKHILRLRHVFRREDALVLVEQPFRVGRERGLVCTAENGANAGVGEDTAEVGSGADELRALICKLELHQLPRARTQARVLELNAKRSHRVEDLSQEAEEMRADCHRVDVLSALQRARTAIGRNRPEGGAGSRDARAQAPPPRIRMWISLHHPRRLSALPAHQELATKVEFEEPRERRLADTARSEQQQSRTLPLAPIRRWQ